MQDQSPSCYTNEQAKIIFRQAWKDGNVGYTKHCRDRMGERNIDANDLMLLARTGSILNPPEVDIKTGEWKYTIERTKPKLKAVFIIVDKNKIRLLTVEN